MSQKPHKIKRNFHGFKSALEIFKQVRTVFCGCSIFFIVFFVDFVIELKGGEGYGILWGENSG